MSEAAFDRLVHDLSDGTGFGVTSADVEVIHTHISVVFLVGDRVYKIKKPKDLGFLDFTTLERRCRYCHEEVRLNRRLAPDVYEGVVAVVDSGDGPRVSERTWPETEAEGDEDAGGGEAAEGRIVEWAVRMVRLPDDRTLRRLLRDGQAGEPELIRLADRLASFHAEADRSAEISAGGSWRTVQGNDIENYEQLQPFVGQSLAGQSFAGKTISPAVFERLRDLTTDELRRLRPLIEARAEAGVPCDAHGDLRLGHLYFLPAGTPGAGDSEEGDEIVAIDCIEFNERFRWADPVADIAFTAMELEFENRPELARSFAERYLAATDDAAGRELLPYFTTYRDIVRGKVRSLESADEGVPEPERERAAQKARRHFLRALSRMAEPGERPGLAVVYGLPGVGKSTLSRELARSAGFDWIDTDAVRKELFNGEAVGSGSSDDGGSAGDASGAGETGGAGVVEVAQGESSDGFFETGLYTPDRTRRTYEECLERARQRLFDGGRVVIEGSFRKDEDRKAFTAAAKDLGVRAVLLECELSREEARRRLADRTSGVSDADWRIYREMAEQWEPHSAETAAGRRTVSLEGDAGKGVARALEILSDAGLVAD